jgi:hypothetical protein
MEIDSETAGTIGAELNTSCIALPHALCEHVPYVFHLIA